MIWIRKGEKEMCCFINEQNGELMKNKSDDFLHFRDDREVEFGFLGTGGVRSDKRKMLFILVWEK